MRPIRWIVIHHSASPRATTVGAIRDFHMNTRGWKHIGYHKIVEEDGTVYAGRKLENVGAHAFGHNRDSIGICVVGDNTKEQESWSKEQIETLNELVHSLRLRFPEAEILGHRDLEGAHTLCPGLDVRELLGLPKELGVV